MNNNLVVEKIDVPDVDSFLSKIVAFFKKQIVLTIAILAMAITCFYIPIDRQYLNYFNYRRGRCASARRARRRTGR